MLDHFFLPELHLVGKEGQWKGGTGVVSLESCTSGKGARRGGRGREGGDRGGAGSWGGGGGGEGVGQGRKEHTL